MIRKDGYRQNGADARAAGFFRRCLRCALIAGILALTLLCAAGCGQDQTADGADTYQQGVDALEEGDLDTAMKLFKTAVDQDSRKAEAYRGQGIVYMKQEAYASAVTMFERSLTAWKRSKSKDTAFREDVQFYLADAYANSNKIEEAMQLYTDLTSSSVPDKAYLMRGVTSLKDGNIEAAMDDFDHAVMTNAGYANCIKIYEALAAASHKADGASYLEKSLDSTPQTAEEYYNQGLVYYYLGNYDRARSSFSQAADGGYQESIAMLGKVSIENGNTQEARAAYKKVVATGENLAIAYNGLALCDIADEAYDDALDNIQKGLAAKDEDITEALLFNEIVVYEKKLDFETAREKMQSFLEQYPENESAKRENVFLQSR